MNRHTTSRRGQEWALFALFRNRDYTLFVVATAVSLVGTRISGIALPLLALAMTDSPVWAGLLGAAQQLPYLVFSLPAGAWVDRTNRKRLLVACDLARAVLLGSIPLAYWLGVLSIGQLLLVVFISGICTVLFEVTDVASLPLLVEPMQLSRARSVSEGIDATAVVVGPGIGGLIVSLGSTTIAGAVLAYLVDGVSYLLSAVGLMRVRRSLQPAEHASHLSLRAAIGEGLRTLWSHPTLRVLLVLTTAVNFLQAPLSLLAIVVAKEQLLLGSGAIGLTFGVAGSAAVAGSLVAGWLYRPERLPMVVLGSLAMWTLSAGILAVATNSVLLTLGLALTHFVWPIYAVAVVSYRLAATPNHLHGRVTSAFRALSYGAEPLGLALGGWAVTLLGPSMLFGAIAALLAGCLAVALLVVRRKVIPVV